MKKYQFKNIVPILFLGVIFLTLWFFFEDFESGKLNQSILSASLINVKEMRYPTPLNLNSDILQTELLTDSVVNEFLGNKLVIFSNKDDFIDSKIENLNQDNTIISRDVFYSHPQPLQSSIEGFLSIFHEDRFQSGISINKAVVITPEKKIISLDYNQMQNFLSKNGSYIKLTGLKQLKNNDYIFQNIEILKNSGSANKRSNSDPTGKLSIVLFNFINDPSQPISHTEARDSIFKSATTGIFSISIKEWFHKVSYGQMNLAGKKTPDANGDVYGWYTLNESCSENTFNLVTNINNALGMAKADGLVVDDDDFIIFVFPKNEPCGALAANALLLPIDPTNPNSGLLRVAVMDHTNFNFGTIVHELGHLLAPVQSDHVYVQHAKAYVCKDITTRTVVDFNHHNSLCEIFEYGDNYDVMGRDGYGNFFSNQSRIQSKFLDINNYSSVTTSGQYTVSPTNTSSTNIVSIPMVIYSERSIPPMGMKNQELYNVETRIFDQSVKESNIPSLVYGMVSSMSNPQIQNTIFIRNKNILVDMINPGEIFNDKKNNLIIKNLGPVSPGSGETLIDIQLPQDPIKCHFQKPDIHITPQRSTVPFSSVINLNIEVKNNNTPACPPVKFYLEYNFDSVFSMYQNPDLSPIVQQWLSAVYGSGLFDDYFSSGQIKSKTISIFAPNSFPKTMVKITINPYQKYQEDDFKHYSIQYPQSTPVYIGFGDFTPLELRIFTTEALPKNKIETNLYEQVALPSKNADVNKQYNLYKLIQ